MRRHLLSIDDLSRDDIERILGRAESFAEVSGREIKKVPTLRGRTVINLFYEASTRTSSSFELAAKRLSADLVSVKSSGSSVDKGESLKDTVQTLSAYDPAAIVIRSPHAGAAALVARWTRASVINAGRRQARAPDPGAARPLHAQAPRRLARGAARSGSSGDVLHSRVARSGILAFSRMGCEVTVCGPPTLIPRGIESLGCRVRTTLDELARGRRRLRPAHAARAHGRLVRALAARVRRAVPDRRPAAEAQPAADAPRPGQPRRGAGRRGDRLAAGADRPSRSSRAWWCGWRCSTSCSPASGAPAGVRGAARRPSPSRHEPPARARPGAGRRAATVLIRGARLLDPRAGLDGAPTCWCATASSPRSATALEAPQGAELVDGEGLHALPGVRRPARAPAHARAARTRRTSTPAPAPPPRAASARSSPSPTPTRWWTRRRCCARCASAPAPRPASRPASWPRSRSASAASSSPRWPSWPTPARPRFTDDGLPVRSGGRDAPGAPVPAPRRPRCWPCTRRTRRCPGRARCTRARCRRCSAWPASRRSPSRPRWRATARSPPTRTGASTCSTCPRSRPSR